MTQLRYLMPDTAQFRAQVLALLRTFTDQGATVLFTSEASHEAPDDDLRFLSDGVVTLLRCANGARTLEVSKLRGSDFLPGPHDVTLGAQGMRVLPRLIPSQHSSPFAPQLINSGIPELDALAGGGVHRGTITLLSGPSGSGKTTLGMQFMKEAAGRGESSALFLFEEDIATLLHRADALRMPLRGMAERGMLHLERIEPLHYTPIQLAHALRHQVEQRHVQIVMLDSIAGYGLALSGHDPLVELHTLCQYLKNMGVSVFIVNEVDASTAGRLSSSTFDLSPLVDNVLLLNLVVEQGALRKQVRVLKRRTGDFDKRLAYMDFTEHGIRVQLAPQPGLEASAYGSHCAAH
nr:ATPase domain-containing protein [Halorhodospira abdelmalekii]